jgi:hypothetical protein
MRSSNMRRYGEMCHVLWSRRSVESDWVKEEAEEGVRRGILIPVLIEDVEIPLGFRRKQAARLSEWSGDADDPEFIHLTNAVATILGQPQVQSSARPRTTSRRWWHTIPGVLTRVAASVAGVSALVMVLYQAGFFHEKEQTIPQAPSTTATAPGKPPFSAASETAPSGKKALPLEPTTSEPLPKPGSTLMPAKQAPTSSNEEAIPNWVPVYPSLNKRICC